MNYVGEVIRAMEMYAENPKVIFLGQSICYPGNSIYRSLETISNERKVEMPVTEEFQMGFSIGLALAGRIPVTTYPRFDFLVLAANQMTNHLDKMKLLTGKQPQVIIRTMVGSQTPLNAGPQHTQDHTEAFRLLCPNIDVVELKNADIVFDHYCLALVRKKATLFIEYGDLYV